MHTNQFVRIYSQWLRLFFWTAVITGTIGCTTPTTLKPTADILKDAERSFYAAESAESVRYAPDDFLLAKSALSEAKAALKDSESTDNLELKESKRKRARRATYDAWLYAEVAMAKTREEKAKEQTKQLRLEIAQLQADRQRFEAEAQVAREKRAKEAAEIGKSLALKEAQEAENKAALERAVKELAIKAQFEAEQRAFRESAAKEQALKQDLESRLAVAMEDVAKVHKEKRGLVVSLSDILFETNGSKLAPGARDNLIKLSAILSTHPDRRISVEGHTDNLDNDESTQQLSEARAQTVRDTLIDAGINPNAVKAIGFGKTKPIASNATPQGRQQNRRVDVVVLNPTPQMEGLPETATSGETQP
jgi:outer membrane protein OmpA-like peptidoglycan-associated protein